MPFEFKLNSAPDASRLKGLKNGMADLGVRKEYVVYPGKEDYPLGNGVETLAAEPLLRGTLPIDSL